jgi:hypothetical protein
VALFGIDCATGDTFIARAEPRDDLHVRAGAGDLPRCPKTNRPTSRQGAQPTTKEDRPSDLSIESNETVIKHKELHRDLYRAHAAEYDRTRYRHAAGGVPRGHHAVAFDYTQKQTGGAGGTPRGRFLEPCAEKTMSRGRSRAA